MNQVIPGITATPIVTAETSSGRDVALDVARGLCLVSMVVGHLAPGTTLHRATHPSSWVDSAFGFVLISGILIGITQCSAVRRGGFTAGARKLLRRTKVIYIGHLSLVAVALLVVGLDLAPVEGVDRPESATDWAGTVFGALTLTVRPSIASVLSTYVILMLWSLISLALLARGRLLLVLVVSVSLYAVGQVADEQTSIGTEEGAWSLAAWQAVFVVGVTIGWYWRSHTVQRVLHDGRALVAVAVVAIPGIVISVPGLVTWPNAVYPWLSALTRKATMAPLRFVVSLAVLALIYVMVRRVSQSAPALLRPLQTLGQRSLDCYIILGIAALILPAIGPGWVESTQGSVMAVAVVICCWAWSKVRAARSAKAGLTKRGAATSSRVL